MNKSINILLATYNSACFLKPQLDSLFAQSCQDFVVYVHDDGSSDETLHIINDYTAKYSEQIILLADKNTGKGASKSFMWLLENTTNTYYMFCDHDDVWFPYKIEETLSKMKKMEDENPNKPVLIHSDLMVVDNKLNPIADSLWKLSRTNPEILKQLDYLTISNSVTGCTMMINQKAKEIALPMHPRAIMHDWWIALCVSKNGIIEYINKPMGLYRQHANNAIGASTYEKHYFISKIKTLTRVLNNNMNVYKQSMVVNRISILKYLYLKILYHFKRRHF